MTQFLGSSAEEYAASLDRFPELSSVTDGKRIATVNLHTRGPLDMDMPAYILRGYTLHWAVTSMDGNMKFSEGDLPLPTLVPAAQWSGEIEFIVPAEEYIMTMSIIRPTGYSVIERSYNLQG